MKIAFCAPHILKGRPAFRSLKPPVAGQAAARSYVYRKPRRTLALRHNSLIAIQPFFSSRDRGGGKGRSTPWGGHEQKLYRSGGTLPSSAGPDMSRWLREKAERNRQALARLSKRLPTIFPPAVLARALGRPFIPPTPRLAIVFLLACASHPRGSPGPRSSRSNWTPCRLDMAHQPKS